jgi:kumamolisin
MLSPSHFGALALAATLTLGAVPRLPLHAARTAAPRPAAPYLGALHLAATDLGPVAPGTPLSLVLVVRDPTAARQAADLTALYAPRSPRFGHYLTARELAARYGPAPATMARVRAALARLGLGMNWQRGNTWLLATGPARRVEAAFRVRARWYRAPSGSRFYAGDRAPTLPAALRPYVAAVGQLSSYFQLSRRAAPVPGLAPADLLRAYDITPLRRLGLDGAGQTVALYEVDGFAQRDLDTFSARLGLPPLRPVIVAGPRLAAGPETEMDLEVVHAIAPRARLVLYNFDVQAAARQAGSDNTKFVDLDLALQSRMVRENAGGVISDSVGMCEAGLGRALALAYKNVYDQADALGVSVFVASGDDGAFDCITGLPRGTPPGADSLAVDLPADTPGVTATGGTRLSVSPNGDWYNETVWDGPAETVGPGGGVSSYYSRPGWQQGPGVRDPRYNPHNMRSIPDVAADADPVSGAAIYGPGSAGWGAGSGTSQAAPIWAAITVLIDQYLRRQGLHRAGFMNPALYYLAAHPRPYRALHDVTMGSNLYYPATPGYDMATGLGTPDAWNLARDLAAYQRGGRR